MPQVYRHPARHTIDPHTFRDLVLNTGPANCILTNANVFSPDGKWVVYDIRSSELGEVFDGDRIEQIHIETGEVQVLYQARHGAHVGVVTYHPIDDAVIFIEGPEHPTADWSYAVHHRQGVIVYADKPNVAHPLEARDLIAPFTAGALRGGTHLHVFSGDGQCASFTYDDAVLPMNGINTARNVGVSVRSGVPVIVPKTHPRNRDGEWFSVLVTRTVNKPAHGSDEISRAAEEAWVGTDGYLRPDGSRQRWALAFQGIVQSLDGRPVAELFIVDLPEDLTQSGHRPDREPDCETARDPAQPHVAGPLPGTNTTAATILPVPPAGTTQRRITFTADAKFPGIFGPRHWPRSSPDGSRIAFLMRDARGIVQLWTISPNGGSSIDGRPEQITYDPFPIASAFNWHPDGIKIAYIADGSVFFASVTTHKTHRLTDRARTTEPLLPLACVFDPTGQQIAYQQRQLAPPGKLASRNRIRICQLAE